MVIVPDLGHLWSLCPGIWGTGENYILLGTPLARRQEEAGEAGVTESSVLGVSGVWVF